MDRKIKYKCIFCGFLVAGAFFSRYMLCPHCGGRFEECLGDVEENPDIMIDRHGTIVIYSDNKTNSGTETTAYFQLS